ncbi:MAG: ABC transporter permease [Candidatus Bathyarchaeota archaeon]|nr:ABC transporter permease [Candidatus Bathyarchaeota archaeon]
MDTEGTAMTMTLSRKTFGSELRAVWMVALRGLRTSMRYKLGFISNIIWPSITVIGVILMGKSFGATEEFVEATGIFDYVSFFILGKIFYTFWTHTVSHMGNSVRDEQLWGTLELTYMCPIKRITLFIGYALQNFIENLLWISSTVILGVSAFGLSFHASPSDIPLMLAAFAVTVAVAYGFGFIIAGLVFRLKEPGVLSVVIFRPLHYFSGCYYTINSIPSAIREFAFVVPTSYSVDVLKSLLLGSKTFLPLNQELMVLMGFALTLPLIGYRFFQWLEKDAMEKGKFATY